MKTITNEQIDKSIEILGGFTENEIESTIEDINQNQPALFAYLMAVTEMYDEDIREEFFFIGFSVINIITTNSSDNVVVPIEALDKFENENLILFSDLDGKNEEDIQNLLSEIIEKYDQKDLLIYVVDELFSEDESGGLFFELDEIGVMLAYLKTIIDSFNM